MMKNLCVWLAVVVCSSACNKQPEAQDPPKTEDPTIAEVLDKKIRLSQKDKLRDIILRTLLEQYAKEHKIEPSRSELDAFIAKTNEREVTDAKEKELQKKEAIAKMKAVMVQSGQDLARIDWEAARNRLDSVPELSKAEKEKLKEMEDEIAKRWVQAWKVNKALFKQYGGRVIFQQAGPEPLDAYRDFLKEQEKNGSFRILDKRFEPSFWDYFLNDKTHTFILKTREEGLEIFRKPFWLMDKPLGE